MNLASCLLVALAVAVATVSALDDDYWVNNRDRCVSSGLPPREPAGLHFCTWYSNNACCLPGADEEIMEKFMMTMELGAGCSPSSHLVKATYKEIRDVMCLPCDPHEPRFRFLAHEGDAITPADPSAGPTDYTWRICKSFLYGTASKPAGLWGKDGSKYDRCGLQHLDQCSDHKQYHYNTTTNSWMATEFDAQTQAGHYCDGDLIVPSIEYANITDPAEQIMMILWMIMPVDWKFVVVDDLHANFSYDATPCFRGSSAALVSCSAAVALLLAILALLF